MIKVQPEIDINCLCRTKYMAEISFFLLILWEYIFLMNSENKWKKYHFQMFPQSPPTLGKLLNKFEQNNKKNGTHLSQVWIVFETQRSIFDRSTLIFTLCILKNQDPWPRSGL